MDEFNPSRLDVARRRRGLTKSGLARKAGITTRALSNYERQERTPSDDIVERLAAAVEFPPAFLVGDDLEEPRVEGVSFRSLSSMTAKQRDQAIGSAAIAMQLDDWIRARFNLPEPSVPRLPEGIDAELAADAVRQAWGLGEKRITNIVHLLEKHGVRVFSIVQECAEVDAYSFWRGDTPYIFLNNQKTAERSRMDAAHELAHLVMHGHGGPRGREAENAAQAFGSAFLMPRRSVLAAMPRGASPAQIVQGRRGWNVAAMNLAHRMEKLGLLTEWQARRTYIQLGKLGYRSSEPGGIERETSQVLDKVFVALRSDGVTRGQIARALSVPVDEITRVTFGLVLTRQPGGVPTGPAPAGPRPDLRIVARSA